MANTNTVCCMCGDIGFADKLFQCIRCHSRFQHSYCTNYYDEKQSETVRVCDWCLSEERSGSKRGIYQKKHTRRDSSATSGRCGYVGSGDKVEHSSSDREESRNRGKSGGVAAASKPTGRRYKLLKDILC